MTFKTPDFWYKTATDIPLSKRLLIPVGWLYGALTAVRLKVTKPYKAGIPVICIGNLTAGGSGKTPVALALMQLIQSTDIYKSPCFLTRGYGGTQAGPVTVGPDTGLAAGDEALLLMQTAPTIIAHDRAAGARYAQNCGHDLIIMDDGFQNPHLYKDISLVVVNGQTGWGNGQIVPAGPLREFIKAGLQRATALIALDGPPPQEGNKPVVKAQCRVSCPLPRGSRVLGFCALGQPARFRATLSDLGLDVIAFTTFPDHYHYTAHDIDDLKAAAARQNLHLITTEKDAVKIIGQDGISTVHLEIIFDSPDDLLNLIKAQI